MYRMKIACTAQNFIWTCTGTDASRNYLKVCLPVCNFWIDRVNDLAF